VGVDVPAIGQIILAGGGKAEVALRQRVGRGLRAKKIGTNCCFIVDFSDATNTNLIKHSRQRREIIESTPGFAEGILPGGEDFNFEAYGFTKTA
jgi:superfamily II DNA or RNA helicase